MSVAAPGVRFLLDANLSPEVARRLREAGYDSVHVAAVGLMRALDPGILWAASDQDRVLMTGRCGLWGAACAGLPCCSLSGPIALRGAICPPASKPICSQRTCLRSATRSARGQLRASRGGGCAYARCRSRWSQTTVQAGADRRSRSQPDAVLNCCPSCARCRATQRLGEPRRLARSDRPRRAPRRGSP